MAGDPAAVDRWSNSGQIPRQNLRGAVGGGAVGDVQWTAGQTAVNKSGQMPGQNLRGAVGGGAVGDVRVAGDPAAVDM